MADNDAISSSIVEIKSDLRDVKDKLHSIDITMAENTLSLKDHMEQTMLLREIVVPLHNERIGRLSVQKYKKERKQQLLDRLKIPAFVVSVIAAIATVLKMLGKL